MHKGQGAEEKKQEVKLPQGNEERIGTYKKSYGVPFHHSTIPVRSLGAAQKKPYEWIEFFY